MHRGVRRDANLHERRVYVLRGAQPVRAELREPCGRRGQLWGLWHGVYNGRTVLLERDVHDGLPDGNHDLQRCVREPAD